MKDQLVKKYQLEVKDLFEADYHKIVTDEDLVERLISLSKDCPDKLSALEDKLYWANDEIMDLQMEVEELTDEIEELKNALNELRSEIDKLKIENNLD
jgi:predicted  nucleic acid-binding Zn-ribbon protein